MTKNSYPDKPILKFQKTTISMTQVIEYMKILAVETEVKRAAYVIFRIESANGSKGINNNYCGFQADSGRWNKDHDTGIMGTVELKENGTNKLRRFLAFRNFGTSVDMLCERLKARGIYVGGTTHKITQYKVDTPEELALTYEREWVKGNPQATITKEKLNNFLSMYNQAKVLFP